MTEPSLVRQALDELLRRFPGFDLVSIDWQLGSTYTSGHFRAYPSHAGPWLLVELGQRSENFDTVPAWAIWSYAIWKSTGAIHPVGPNGAVSDDPIWMPGG